MITEYERYKDSNVRTGETAGKLVYPSTHKEHHQIISVWICVCVLQKRLVLRSSIPSRFSLSLGLIFLPGSQINKGKENL
jgi:hypothetical protein